MKPLALAALFAITLSSYNSSFASEVVADRNNSNNNLGSNNIVKISPTNLVKAAYQGRFKNQGIPSNGRFLAAVRSNRIQAEDLAEVAIATGRLDPQTLDSDQYLNSLQGTIDRFKKRRL
ncbi:MAG: hypothetical protein AAF652_03325 [Cyanobacteria bacterium P01_C01_bin.72]